MPTATSQEIFVTVVDVTSKSGTSKKNEPYTLYFVQLSDGNTYKTFKNPVATQARQLQSLGTPAKATVHSEKSSGDYPDDLFIDSIEPAVEQGGTLTQEKVVAATGSPNGSATLPIRDRNDDIRTQFAIKAAINYVTYNGTGDPEKDLVTVGRLAREIYTLAVEGISDKKTELPTW